MLSNPSEGPPLFTPKKTELLKFSSRPMLYLSPFDHFVLQRQKLFKHLSTREKLFPGKEANQRVTFKGLLQGSCIQIYSICSLKVAIKFYIFPVYIDNHLWY